MMEDVVIQEATYNSGRGKIGILMYTGSQDPVAKLDEAVRLYTDQQGYNEFIDANMDNPWIRVIVKGINDMEQIAFNPRIHKL